MSFEVLIYEVVEDFYTVEDGFGFVQVTFNEALYVMLIGLDIDDEGIVMEYFEGFVVWVDDEVLFFVFFHMDDVAQAS